MPRDVDDDFTALPLHALADAALDRARELGASHADVRIERGRSLMVRLRDGALEGANDTTDMGLSVRVVVDGTWGFAARVDLDVDAAVRHGIRSLITRSAVPSPQSCRRTRPSRAGAASSRACRSEAAATAVPAGSGS